MDTERHQENNERKSSNMENTEAMLERGLKDRSRESRNI